MRETLKSQLAILFILLLIFSVRSWSGILGAAVDGEIPTNLVLSLLGLGIPEMAQLILPLSLFLGLLMTLGKLYTESEITVMHACGLSKAVLVKAAMVLALFTGIVAAVNVMWAGPTSSRHQDEVLAEAKRLADAGVKELLVISQDTSAYGVDVKHRSGFHNGEPVKTSMVGLCEQLAKLGIWTRLHYVYPYPHVDDVIPLMAEGKILRIWISRCNTPARVF